MLDSKKILVGVTVGVAATAATFGSIIVGYEVINKQKKEHFQKMLQPSTETLMWLSLHTSMNEEEYKVFETLFTRSTDLHLEATDFHDLRKVSKFEDEINTFLNDLNSFVEQMR